MAEPNLTKLALAVDAAVRRSIAERGHPRTVEDLIALDADVRRRMPGVDFNAVLTGYGG
jgi:hypothetical protein